MLVVVVVVVVVVVGGGGGGDEFASAAQTETASLQSCKVGIIPCSSGTGLFEGKGLAPRSLHGMKEQVAT